MASEARPGEGRAAPGGWEDLGLRSGPFEGRFPGCPGEQPPESCSAKPEQVAAGAQAKDQTPQEAAIFCGVLVEESGAWGERAEAHEEVVVVVGDVIEEVEVVTVGDKEEQEQAEEQEQREEPEPKQAQPSPAPCSLGRSLEALEIIQLELNAWNTRANRAYFCLRRKLLQTCKPYLDRRRLIIQCIPGFWVQAIVNHPQISAMISEVEEDILSYLINLEVQEFRGAKNHCKIMFFFESNPYFQNEMIIKEYEVNVSGYRASHSTPIQWLWDYERESRCHRQHDCRLHFFSWFSDHNSPGSNRITEIICKDLWVDPLRYYLRD
ncbi:testis-specific Y-encoded protein 2-like [Loxodonta africana]|uniref:testis-specific Y-encoded protein 2-like n=1 Tax=Loxodonta africana TaxID=9785 RepID=UPI0030D2F6C2